MKIGFRLFAETTLDCIYCLTPVARTFLLPCSQSSSYCTLFSQRGQTASAVSGRRFPKERLRRSWGNTR